MDSLLEWVNQLSALEFFVCNSVLSVVSFVPGLAATLATAAGALFGLLGGTALYASSATIGAIICFLIARFGPRSYLKRIMASNAVFKVLMSPRVAEDGFKLTFLLRLSPVTPFVVCSFLLGLSEIPLQAYALATLAGLVPASFVYVYVGSLGQMAASSGGQDTVQLAVQGLGLLATAVVTWRIVLVAQQTLNDLKETK